MEFEISGRCKRLVYRPFPCSVDRLDRRKAINVNDSCETREREKEREVRRERGKEKCMPTFEYVSMHILPDAIGKDFHEIPKSRNSRRAEAGRRMVTDVTV